MKKTALCFVFVFLASAAFSWVCDGCPEGYKYNFDNNDILGGRSWLPDMASKLENGHNIRVFIKIDGPGNNYDVEKAAKNYFVSITAASPGNALLIFTSEKQHRSYIAVTDGLRAVFPEKYVSALQEDVLDGLQGKWYIGYKYVLAKTLGAFVYILEKDKMTAEQIKRQRPYMIIVDDPLYNISLLPVINDVIKMFYMEPLSFIFYFPFIMYFLIVRWIGCNTNRIGFAVSNAVWGLLMIFFAVLIINRVNIYFSEYTAIFTVICGFNIPVYAALFMFYRDKIEAAAYNYVKNVTGGFEGSNTFGGKIWEK